MRPRAGEVGLVDCLFLTLISLGAIAIALFVGHRWGPGWSLVALPLGFFAILGALYVIGMIAALVERGWFPRCHQGTCSGDWQTVFGDYNIVRFGDDFGYRCRCGIDYKKEGRRFMLRRPDGTLEPYMIWTWPRGYVRDDGT